MKYDRHWQMNQQFLQKKQISNKELCEMFSISIETVRRDLNILEKEGVIRRVYGGAVLADDNIMPESMQAWNAREAHNLPQKQAMAQALLRYIPDNSTIAMDSGTSILEIARLLGSKKNLSILTNSVRTAAEISTGTGHMVYMIGGAMKKDEMITTGFLATDFLSYFSHVDIALISADGFTVSEGISDYSVEMGTLKAAMIEKADKVYACVDSSKFSAGAFYKVCAADRLDLLVTDAGTPRQPLDELRAMGVQVVQTEV